MPAWSWYLMPWEGKLNIISLFGVITQRSVLQQWLLKPELYSFPFDSNHFNIHWQKRSSFIAVCLNGARLLQFLNVNAC